MPSGIYKRKPFSEEHKKRISESKKGLSFGWKKGMHHSEESRKKISKGLKGKKFNKERRKKFSEILKREWLLGKTKKKIGEANREKGFETHKKMSATKLGIKLDQWQGFASSKNKLEREAFRKQLQRKVFKRDNYTCQLCGIKGVALQVDHIQSWAEYIELRFNINNCRTLCQKCHYKITFGKPMPPTIRTWGHNFKFFYGK